MSWDNMTIPERVFIEREGAGYDYSEDQPALLRNLNGYGNNGFGNMFNGSFLGNINYLSLFYSLPEVAGAVHVIADAVADANWKLMMFMNDKAVYTDNNFNRLFTTPNPLNTIRELIYNAVATEILTGKQFFYFNRPSTLQNSYDNILSWFNLPADNVCVEMLKGIDPYSATVLSDYVKEYKCGQRIFEAEKVLPIVHLDITASVDLNNTKPMISGAERAIRNLIAVYEARGAIYQKRGSMGMWVSRKSDSSGVIALSPNENKMAREELNATYGLTGNRATVGITSQPLDFIKTSMSIAEMLPFDETLSDAVAIYSVLGIPRSMVPSKDSGTFNNVESDKKSFYTKVIIPWAQKYADNFTQFMQLEKSRRYIKADYSHIGVLQDNLKEKSQVDKTYGDVFLQRWTSGICSLNEWITATEGEKGIGNIYEKKIFDLTPDEVALVKSIINLKVTIRDSVGAPGQPIDNTNTNTNGTTAANSGN